MPLATYRKVLEQMWTAKLLAGEHLASLVQLQGQLGITAEDAGAIEQEVMGMTKAEAMVMGIAKSTPPTSVPPFPAIDPGESAEQPEPRDDDFSGATQVPNGRGATPLPAADEGDLDLEGGTYAPARPAVHGDRNDLASGMHLGLGNRYELLDKIGEGGMGTVWRAKDLTLDGRIVAMKRIRLFDEADRQMVARFAQERQTIAGLNHSNVVTVYDAGDDQYGPYLVMELVEGEPLDQLTKQGALPESRAVEIIEGLCRGVAHAHKKGVIHRDIKPANVIVNTDGIPKLLDFGLARGGSALELSMSGYGMGTLDYAAPEQKLDAKSVDHRADIYSLGLTFYELLTGLKPVPLHLPKVSKRWQSIVAHACEPDPVDRYQSADDLVQAIVDARTASLTDLVLDAEEGGDDLRCPACKRMNALEARVCRGCGETLVGECPACTGPLRVGLLNCDKCGATVKAIRVAQSLSSSAESALESKQIGLSLEESQAGLDALEGARFGAASSLKSDLERVHAQATDLAKKVEELVDQGRELAAHVDPVSAMARFREASTMDPSLVDEFRGDMNFLEGCQALLLSIDLEAGPRTQGVEMAFNDRSGQLEILLSAVGGALWVEATDSESAKRAEDGLGAFLRDLSSVGLDESTGDQLRAIAEKLQKKAREAREAREVREAAEALNPFGWDVVDATPGANGHARMVHDPLSDVTFVLIDPGEFVMGSLEMEKGRDADEIEHRVQLTLPYYLGETQVTQKQWARSITRGFPEGSETKGRGRFVSMIEEASSLFGFLSGGDSAQPSHFKGTNLPVESVDWKEAHDYCARLSKLAGQVTYRLPTEAEWEYACRAGTTTRFSCGDIDSSLSDVAWYVKNGGMKTHPVKSKEPNAWGLHDMLGNVWEWCCDWYGDYPSEECVDPGGPSYGSDRVLRGGSWSSHSATLRSADRTGNTPAAYSSSIGFRVLAVPPSSPSAKAGKGV